LSEPFNFETASDSEAARLRALWASVLSLAISDAFSPSGGKGAKPHEQQQALSFCLSKEGKWKREREEVCALASTDADSFYEAALALEEKSRAL